MQFPGEANLLAERASLLDTLDRLADDQFEAGRTLCEGWAPRDILAHLIGVDRHLATYVLAKGSIDRGNAHIVAATRSQRRDRLMRRARHWATHPAPHARAAATYMLGDISIHHQDIVRGQGIERGAIPAASRAAILRMGMAFGARKLLSHTIEPTDGGRSLGRGPRVRGTSEALGMWLAGREGIERDLEFLGA